MILNQLSHNIPAFSQLVCSPFILAISIGHLQFETMSLLMGAMSKKTLEYRATLKTDYPKGEREQDWASWT